MTTSHSRGRVGRLLALVLALALVAAACGGGTSDTTTTAAPDATTTTAAAGGETTTTAAPAEPEPEGPSGTLTIAWQWDPSTMDPQMHRQRFTQIISHAMRDKLYIQDPPGLTLVPLLGEGAPHRPVVIVDHVDAILLPHPEHHAIFEMLLRTR